MRSGGLSVLAMAAIVHAAPARAQAVDDPEDGGRTIVVTATPLTDPQEDRLRFPAQTVSDEAMERLRATDLTDHLKRAAGGVFVNEVQGNPLQPDINYRGFTASPLLGTPQGLSVYLDGVRVNQPFGDVVSWDLIPTTAIRSATLMPGSNPLFGRNALGGALSVRTKDGVSDPGVMVDASIGSWRRRIVRAQAGSRIGEAWSLYASGDYFAEHGWRAFSPSEAANGFAKLRWAAGASEAALSVAGASTDLNGNGLQELRLLAADRSSVYTHPDTTRNRAVLVNLNAGHDVAAGVRISANAFWRRIRTRTLNGDINDEALGQDLARINDEERAALAGAGVPLTESAAFPRLRCIANILLNDEPNEKCNGLLNRSTTRQREVGGAIELRIEAAGAPTHALTLGAAYVDGRARFGQTAQFGYLTPERGVATFDGPGAFADGTQASEELFDARVDLDARTRVFSAYALDTVRLSRTLKLDLSARYDRTTVRNRDAITPGGGTGSLDGDHDFARVNPAVALRWDGGRGVTFDAAWSQASRAPSAIELGCADPESPCRLPNSLAGDPPLAQVVAQSVEGGIGLTVGPATLRLGAFRTDATDDILFVAADAAGFGYFRNFGRTRRQGIDAGLSATMGRLSLSAHYTYLDATYRSAETVGGAANSSSDAVVPGSEDGRIAIRPGDRIPGLVRHLAKASVGWRKGGLAIVADVIASGGVIARGNENQGHRADGRFYLGPGATRPYAVVNLGAEARPARALTVYAQVNNLFDKHYATAAQLGPTGFDAAGQFVARPFDAPVVDDELPRRSSTFFAPGAPRSVRVGARVSF